MQDDGSERAAWLHGILHIQEGDLEDAPMTGGGSDANFTSAMGVPTLDGLGADGDSAHTLHEHILASTLEARLNFWRHLLAHLA